jgi:2-octaprenyl-6-methoxyphenol hydroxylase
MQHEHAAARFDVVVSGASYAGLALALALTEALPGLQVALVDPVAPRGSGEPARDPRAFAVSASSRHVLDAIGVWPAVAAEAQPVVSIEITDSELGAGVRPTLLTYANATENGEPASYILPGAALLAALVDKARVTPGITLIAPPAAVVGYSAGPNDAEVRLADGRRIEARLVVAAEGRKSTLREAAGIKLVGWPYRQTGIVVTVAHERPHDGTAVQHFLPAGPFAILPLTGNRSCITWSEEAREARRILALDDHAFLAEIDKRFGGKLGAVTVLGKPASWPLEMHLARAYVAPRLALIGDTAHGVHPIAGQGLNLGLRDVAALAEVVAETMRVGLDPGSPDVLTRYERWRRFDSTVSTFAFDSINRLFSNDWTVVRAARDLGLGLVDRMPTVKRLLVSEAAGLTGDLPRMLRGEAL